MGVIIEVGSHLPLLKAEPGEQVDIITFVVTPDGWAQLKDRLQLSPANPVRILTRLIHKSASELLIEQAGGKWQWHYLPGNHAKAIIYRKQQLAILGSFNLTTFSLGKNLESSYRVNGTDYAQIVREFEAYWNQTKRDEHAFRTPAAWQAVSSLFENPDERETRAEGASSLLELTNGYREPWPFQEEIIQQVMTWLDSARQAPRGRIVTLPTGAGKTLVAAEVIRRFRERRPQARILWVCHRVELLRQSWKSVRAQLEGILRDAAWFVPQHIKQDDTSLRDPKEFVHSKQCQLVFCTQGMLRHCLKHNRPRHLDFDFIVVDECHRFHPGSKLYQQLFTYCKERNIPRLGLTATPLTDEKRDFGQYWDTEALFGRDVTKESLEQQGFLSRLNQQLTRRWKTDFIFRVNEQYGGREQLERALVTRIREFNNDRVNRAVQKAWEQYRLNRQRTLCFAVTVEHANTLKQRFFAEDNCVQVVHSKMDLQTIQRVLEWFKEEAHESRMLVSVLMLTEGIDLPKTDCLFMVRPTFSRELYDQMIGRGFRGVRAGGTDDCAIVDFTSQFVSATGDILPFEQVTTGSEGEELAEITRAEPAEDDEPDDQDQSGEITTVGALKEAIADLQDQKGLTIQAACEELAPELDYKASTLVNYYYTKPDDYPLGWEDPESDPAELTDDDLSATDLGWEVSGQRDGTFKPSGNGLAPEGYVTRRKLQDLRIQNPRLFEQIASLTDVESSTLQAYCSNQENFRRWRNNNRAKMDKVLRILAELRTHSSDAA
jgi:superfamily II DNA or RNA helicase